VAQVIEKKEWRNREEVYADRREAGEVLAAMLEPYCKNSAIVLAVPSGGVPVGLAISRILRIDFDLIIIRKIPIPGETEAGFGAISLEGDLMLNQQLVQSLRLTPEIIQQQKKPVEQELRERNLLFRGNRPLPELAQRTVVLVDDGLASGVTMAVAASVARRRKPAKVIIASPTAPLSTVRKLGDSADIIICPNIREGFYFAVASAYRRWHDLEHDEVTGLLQESGWLHGPASG